MKKNSRRFVSIMNNKPELAELLRKNRTQNNELKKLLEFCVRFYSLSRSSTVDHLDTWRHLLVSPARKQAIFGEKPSSQADPFLEFSPWLDVGVLFAASQIKTSPLKNANRIGV